MTNYEKITNMSIDELAEELYLGCISDCNNCPCDKYNYKECYNDNCDCILKIKQWLGMKVGK